MIRLAARAPRRAAFLAYADWAERRLDDLGVAVRRGVTADAETVLSLDPEAVVVATGARPRRADAKIHNSARAYDFAEVLRGDADLGRRVVLVSEDDHMITPSVADSIAAGGRAVVILHKWTAIAEAVDRYTRGIVFHRLYSQGVVLHPMHVLVGFDGAVVRAANTLTGKLLEIDGVDSVVFSLGMESDDRLARDLKGRVAALHNVGSSFAPRFVAEATQHGANVGRLL
jgi:hypothetical protein